MSGYCGQVVIAPNYFFDSYQSTVVGPTYQNSVPHPGVDGQAFREPIPAAATLQAQNLARAPRAGRAGRRWQNQTDWSYGRRASRLVRRRAR